jgi:dTDP-4-dehydrorhamnose reductase
MKILLTGSSGQVARAFLAAVPQSMQVTAVNHSDLDIGDAVAVDSLMESLRPDAVVNGAAYTAVDRAESEPDAARRANEAGPANLARAAARIGSRLVHLSTDFVFDGASSSPYKPQDPTNPLGVYGASKLAGETAVREVLPARSVILRTGWVYDAHGRNFLRTMLRLMRERGTVSVVADQVGTPTAAFSIAQAICAVLELPSVTGIHHWSDAGVASWYDFAVAIAEEWVSAGRATVAARVIPIGTADYPTPARRPKFSVLDKSSTCAALGLTPRHWRQNLRQVIGEISNA